MSPSFAQSTTNFLLDLVDAVIETVPQGGWGGVIQPVADFEVRVTMTIEGEFRFAFIDGPEVFIFEDFEAAVEALRCGILNTVIH